MRHAKAATPRLACASCWSTTRGSCGSRPLRPPAALLHKAALPSVPGSHCAEAPFLCRSPLRALRVKATGIMQSGLRWRRSPSRRRSPVACTPYAPPSGRPYGYRGAMALVSFFASVPVSGLRPVITCVPLPTHRGLAAARHWPSRAGCPSAPRGGSLSLRAYLVGFCYRLSSSSRTEFGGYRHNGLQASVAAGLLFRHSHFDPYGPDSRLGILHGCGGLKARAV